MRSRFLPVLSSLSILAFSSPACAQVNDDFSDGDFTSGTLWSGSTGLFTVVSDVGNQRLRSASSGAANYYLSTPNTLVNDAQWEFFLDLRFATSGANYVDVYLVSNVADLSGSVNGYFLRIGGTADRIELFRCDAGTGSSLGLQSPDGVVNSSTSNPFRVKVTRSAAGLFTLLFDDGNTGSYTTAGTVSDATYTSTTHFGIRIEQSSAASAQNNHFFDDVSVGLIAVDNTPPSILAVTASSATQVDVQYSEALDPAFIGGYDIIPFIGVSGQTLDGSDASLVHVSPAIALSSGNTYSLLPGGAKDLAGNVYAGPASIDFPFVVPVVALPGDVVINEIMADPNPVVGLPDAEFLEIYNATTNKTFDLAGWTITDGSSTGTLLSLTLPPGAHLILTAAGNPPLFAPFGAVQGLSPFPSLNNDGDALVLKSATGTTIDAVTYDVDWYGDATKALGGWTLERIDPTAPCSGAANWRASNAGAGGTPGAQNSIFAIVPDNTAPTLLQVQVNDANTLVLVFSEAMDAASLITGGYAIIPSVGVLSAAASNGNGAQLELAANLNVGTLYTIAVTGVRDCPGNAIGASNTATFALPEPVEAGDVVINEVLYDPIGTGSDFVELYNRSIKTLSLAGWRLANVSDGVVDDVLTITNEAFLLLPGEYALICESTANIVANYRQSRVDRFVQTDMPRYNDGEGSVFLQATNGTLLDRFDYSDDLHFTLVNNPEGYSLERVDPRRPASDKTNWQTAADATGRATPGFRNSQYAPAPSASGEMTIEQAIFSPDNDGFEDLLTIVYRFDQAGFVGNLTVFDIAGRAVRTLMANELLGTEGAISWDGILDDGSKGRMGPYVVLLEVFDLEGNTERFKKTVTLAHRLD